MRHVHGLAVVAGALCLASGAAYARRIVSFSPAQTSLTTGAGMSDFVGSEMRSESRIGASWDARLTFGTRSPIAFEVGYTGLYNVLNSNTSVSNAPYMMQNAVDGDLRINFLPWRVQPYGFGGVGYNNVSVNNRADDPFIAARFRKSDDQLLVPVGAGLAFYLGRHTTIDARFTYRFIFFNGLMRDGSEPRNDTYTVTGRIGWAF